MGSRVVLAMSGGVDSSVAAHLLKERGHEVIGLFMRTGAHGEDAGRTRQDLLQRRRRRWTPGPSPTGSTSPSTRWTSRRTSRRIMDQFADEYAAGRTPNPCVSCNIWLKFGKLWAYGKQVGADFVATGHYAQDRRRARRACPRIARAVESRKDQSYVLFGLRRELLPHVLLPVGDYRKAEIRALAKDLDLPVHDKADSQEICFIPDDDYAGFVRERRPGPRTSGPIVDEDGTPLGRHARDRGVHDRPAQGPGHRRGRAALRRPDRAGDQHRDRRPRAALRRGGLEASRFNWQVAPPDRPRALPRADPCPAPGRRGDGRTPTGDRASSA